MDNEDIALGAMIKAQADHYRAPSGLREQVVMLLEQAQRPRVAASLRPMRQSWWGMGGAFAAGVLLSVMCVLLYNLLGQQNRNVGQVVDNHVRSLLAAHLSDVASSDQHTVKPWFGGKLTYSPPVRDLAAEGFPLIGGRLDYMDGQPVAALIYRRRLHTINVFVWPARSKSPYLPVSTSQQGFNVQSWQEDGMEFWAVSDIQATELKRLEQLLRTKSASENP